MIWITSKDDLNRAVATAAFCPEPPLSERRAIHESGAWRWVGYFPSWCNTCRPLRRPCLSHTVYPHWEPAPFATCPTASYALRQKMRESNHKYESCDVANPEGVLVEVVRGGLQGNARAEHANECTAFALATLRALGVEFELQGGWDK
tara:strand:- start:843 stop:1286 length:444 start_codon:yes stop_codon:yes gene_type:complete